MSDEMHEDAPTTNVEFDVNELLSTVEQLKSTNERLLSESQKHKTRKSEVDELKEALESYQKRELEQKGNWQEMLKLEQQKRAELEQSLQMQKKKVISSNIFNAVMKAAPDAYDVNDLLAQRDFAKMIEVDEDSLEPIPESISKFTDALKQEKRYLFKGNTVKSMADTKPAIDKPVDKKLNQMNDAEKKEYLLSQISSLTF